jgi:hypothetical protein
MSSDRTARAGHLEQPDADLVGARLVDSEIVERLAHVEIVLADRQDADFRLAPAGIDDPVEPVGADIGTRRIALVFMQPHFLTEKIEIMRADVEPARRHRRNPAG